MSPDRRLLWGVAALATVSVLMYDWVAAPPAAFDGSAYMMTGAESKQRNEGEVFLTRWHKSTSEFLSDNARRWTVPRQLLDSGKSKPGGDDPLIVTPGDRAVDLWYCLDTLHRELRQLARPQPKSYAACHLYAAQYEEALLIGESDATGIPCVVIFALQALPVCEYLFSDPVRARRLGRLDLLALDGQGSQRPQFATSLDMDTLSAPPPPRDSMSRSVTRFTCPSHVPAYHGGLAEGGHESAAAGSIPRPHTVSCRMASSVLAIREEFERGLTQRGSIGFLLTLHEIFSETSHGLWPVVHDLRAREQQARTTKWPHGSVRSPPQHPWKRGKSIFDTTKLDRLFGGEAVRNHTVLHGVVLIGESLAYYGSAGDETFLTYFNVTAGYDRDKFQVWVDMYAMPAYVGEIYNAPGFLQQARQRPRQVRSAGRSLGSSTEQHTTKVRKMTSLGDLQQLYMARVLHSAKQALLADMSPNVHALTFLNVTRKGNIVLLQSHCDALSGRDADLKDMVEAGLSLDSFGRCFNNRPGEKITVSAMGFEGALSAKARISEAYPFSVAFENSQSYDYVTEKLFVPQLQGSMGIYGGSLNWREFTIDPFGVVEWPHSAKFGLKWDLVSKPSVATRNRSLDAYFLSKAWLRHSERDLQTRTPLGWAMHQQGQWQSNWPEFGASLAKTQGDHWRAINCEMCRRLHFARQGVSMRRAFSSGSKGNTQPERLRSQHLYIASRLASLSPGKPAAVSATPVLLATLVTQESLASWLRLWAALRRVYPKAPLAAYSHDPRVITHVYNCWGIEVMLAPTLDIPWDSEDVLPEHQVQVATWRHTALLQHLAASDFGEVFVFRVSPVLDGNDTVSLPTPAGLQGMASRAQGAAKCADGGHSVTVLWGRSDTVDGMTQGVGEDASHSADLLEAGLCSAVGNTTASHDLESALKAGSTLLQGTSCRLPRASRQWLGQWWLFSDPTDG